MQQLFAADHNRSAAIKHRYKYTYIQGYKHTHRRAANENIFDNGFVALVDLQIVRICIVR